jgi:hypothetical protein
MERKAKIFTMGEEEGFNFAAWIYLQALIVFTHSSFRLSFVNLARRIKVTSPDIRHCNDPVTLYFHPPQYGIKQFYIEQTKRNIIPARKSVLHDSGFTQSFMTCSFKSY